MSPNRIIKSLLLCGLLAAAVMWLASGSSSQSVKPAQTKPATYSAGDYVGSEACKDCHEAQSKNFSPTVHAKLATARNWKDKVTGCETCHGPGKAHSAEGDPAKIKNPAKMKPE
ncbi:MAG: hypothetical protein M3R52_07160, partial [Acidobacteriota bacterium]|nr:hypothetical protein [Acidobacteriota bacterium]